jgi:hypothetical protein
VADRTYSILLLHQQADPEERKTEEEHQDKNQPAFLGDFFLDRGQVRRSTSRTPVSCAGRWSCVLLLRRRLLLLLSRGGKRPALGPGIGGWGSVLLLSGLWLWGQARPTVPADAYGIIVELPAVAARNHFSPGCYQTKALA